MILSPFLNSWQLGTALPTLYVERRTLDQLD